jgi:exonuclease III
VFHSPEVLGFHGESCVGPCGCWARLCWQGSPDISILNIYVSNTKITKFIKNKIKQNNHNCSLNSNPYTLILGDFSTPWLPTDKSSRQKLNRGTLELTDILNHVDLTDIYRIFHQNTEEYTFYSSSHRNFSEIDHII